jgi:hypothetical protein
MMIGIITHLKKLVYSNLCIEILFCRHIKPDKDRLLKLSWTVFIVTTFTSHKIVTNGHICDRHNVTDFVI